MSVDGGYDIRILLEGGEQLFLEYLSPGWVEYTLFLLSLSIPGTGLNVRRFDFNWPDERFKEPSKRHRPSTSYPDFT